MKLVSLAEKQARTNPDVAYSRQMETLELYASGHTYAQIAQLLDIDQSTVMARLRKLRTHYRAGNTKDLCVKLGLEFVDGHKPGVSSALTDEDRRFHQLLVEGLSKTAIEQRLGLEGRRYGTIMRRLKKAHGVNSVAELKQISP